MPDKDPWQFFSSLAISDACNTPQAAVEANWPHIHYALDELSIADRLIQAAAIATVAIETASTFEPVREAFWLSENWRRLNLRYYPYYGRGYIQLTWQSNYLKYGDIIGADLVGDPDLAMTPSVAAWVLAHFFKMQGVAGAADDQNWPEARRLVQGGHAGLDRLQAIVAALGV
jgi:predicted chitinase